MKTKIDRSEAINALKNSLADKDLIELWNDYCDDIYADETIEENTEEFLDERCGSPSEAVRAALFGEYNYGDKFVYFDGAGNLQAFEYLDSECSPIDFEELLDWLERNRDAEELAELLELEIDEDDAEDANK